MWDELVMGSCTTRKMKKIEVITPGKTEGYIKKKAWSQCII